MPEPVQDNSKLTVRSYKHQVIDLNKGKNYVLYGIINEYRRVAKILLNKQYHHFLKHHCFNKKAKDFYGNVPTFLSERYKDTIKHQTDGMLESYFSIVKNQFKKYVYNSSLDDETKKRLYKLNKSNRWGQNKLAYIIFKKCLKKHRKPRTKNINMTLCTKVYKLEVNKTTKTATYHVLLKTCRARNETVTISLKANPYFDEQLKKTDFVKINNSLQLIFNGSKLKNVTLSITKKEAEKKETGKIVGLDYGLKNLFTTNMGDVCGQGFYKKLSYYDDKLSKLIAELKAHGIIYLKSSKRYCALVERIRAFIKNETNRVLNRIVKKHDAKKLVVEDLDFSKSELSKKLNRVLSKCGLGNITVKLRSLEQDKGLDVEYVFSKYTSQTCSRCGNVDKKSRVTRDRYECKKCKTKIDSDVNAARNIVGRSKYVQGLDKYDILNIKRFGELIST